METLLNASNSAPGSNERLMTAEFVDNDPIFNRLHWHNEPTTQYKYTKTVQLGDAGMRGLNQTRRGTQSKQMDSYENRRFFSDLMTVDRQIAAGDPTRRTKEEFRKLQAIKEAWLRLFFKGSSANDPTQFDGLQVRASEPTPDGRPSRRLMANSPTGAALSLGLLRRAISNTDGNAILMTESILDRLSEAPEYGNLKGTVTYRLDEFGQNMAFFGNLPIIPIKRDSEEEPILGFTELSPDGVTTNECTSIYIVGFGENKLQGINFKGVDGKYGFDITDQGAVGTELHTLIEWPCSIVNEHHRCLTRFSGIVDAPVTN
jgi:hypothetical protein